MITVLEQAPSYPSLASQAIGHVSRANTSPPTDEQLAIARTLKGDFNAFNELVLRYQQLAYSVAYRMLQSKEAAADAVQESFVKAYRALAAFKGSSFKSWLMRIVVNTCYDMLRLERRLPTEGIRDEPDYDEERGSSHLLMDTAESPTAFVERMELRAQIELGLRILPADQRLVLALYDIHGYSYDDIIDMTGIPMGTLKSRISRARSRLRDFLLQKPDLLPAGFQA